MRINSTQWNRVRYSFYAPFFDVIVRPLEKARQRAIELLAPMPGDRVLIVGAGTGCDLEYLPRGLHITAVDISPAMVDKIRRRAERLGFPVRAEVMDGEKLLFEDRTFDHVILHLILAIIPDPIACAREAARVLKKGGTISILDKFLPDGGHPSWGRRFLNLPANFFFTDINRPLGPLLEAANLEKRYEEPALLRGTFKIVIAGKPGESPKSKQRLNSKFTNQVDYLDFVWNLEFGIGISAIHRSE
ncbi:MAG: class I SAM-dependent methyltransferase [Acidobacteriia bacterium]|nr:class I SAM-dependent methyltransferase [Terriglobia bacterium]